MYSGNTQLCIDSGQEDRTDGHRGEPDETKLSVAQLGQPSERLTPGSWSDQWQQSFEHEHQRTRGQECFRHRSLLRLRSYLAPLRGVPTPPSSCLDRACTSACSM